MTFVFMFLGLWLLWWKFTFLGELLLWYLGRQEKGAVEARRERISDSDQFIEWYQPAGQQPQCCWALPDLWLWENTTARGLREAEKALFVLKLTGKSCVVAVKMDIFLSMDQMGVTSAAPEHWSTTPFRGEHYLSVPQLPSTVCFQLMWGPLLNLCTQWNDWHFPRCMTSRQ